MGSETWGLSRQGVDDSCSVIPTLSLAVTHWTFNVIIAPLQGAWSGQVAGYKAVMFGVLKNQRWPNTQGKQRVRVFSVHGVDGREFAKLSVRGVLIAEKALQPQYLTGLCCGW